MAAWLAEVYERHRQGLFTLALAITASAEDAEDAVHDAALRLCRAARIDAEDPVAYVFGAVRNAAIDLVRGRPRPSAPASIFNGMAAPAADPAAVAARCEETERVQRALGALDDPKREIVVMKVYGQLTFAQIARVLGEPLTTVASRYQRALGEIRANLGADRP